MADFESLQDNVVLSDPCDDEKPIHETETASLEFTLDNPTPQVDMDVDLLGLGTTDEPTETSPVSGIEEITTEPTEQDGGAIIDGFPDQSTKPLLNGSVTPTLSTPTTTTTEEGFEEIIAPPKANEELSKPEKKDDSLKSPLALWMMKQNLHPQVINLLYWVELQRTAGVFGGLLFLLLSCKYYSVIGVVTTLALAILVVAFLYRIGMTIVKAVQKTSAEHPFKHLLEEKIEISEEFSQELASKLRKCINENIRTCQCLFLVNDSVASLKAMVMFWLVSYVAGLINFLTICIWGVVVLFTVPKLYEEKQAEIDQVFALVKSKSCMVCGIIEQKLPEKIKIYLKKDKKE